MIKTVKARELKIGDAIIRADNTRFNKPEIVKDVYVSVTNDRVYVDFIPHRGSVNGGEDFYIRGFHSQVEIF